MGTKRGSSGRQATLLNTEPSLQAPLFILFIVTVLTELKSTALCLRKSLFIAALGDRSTWKVRQEDLLDLTRGCLKRQQCLFLIYSLPCDTVRYGSFPQVYSSFIPTLSTKVSVLSTPHCLSEWTAAEGQLSVVKPLCGIYEALSSTSRIQTQSKQTKPNLSRGPIGARDFSQQVENITSQLRRWATESLESF